MARITRSEFTTQTNSLFPSNIKNAISAEDLRKHLTDLGDSALFVVEKMTDPAASDDSYNIGDVWVNKNTDTVFICVDNTSGAAIWSQIGLSGSEIKTLYESQPDTNAFTDSEKSKLSGIENGATADQTNVEIETAYNTQVPLVTQVEAEAGTVTDVRRWSPERVKQAIDALSSGGASILNDLSDVTITTPVDGALLAYNNGTGDWEDTGTFSSQFDTEFGTKTTTDLSEGTNLYFTDERVDDRVNGLLVGGTNITLTYDDGANTLTIDASGGGASSINDLTDVDTATTPPTDGQALIWDNANSEWIPGDVAASGATTGANVPFNYGIPVTDFDETVVSGTDLATLRTRFPGTITAVAASVSGASSSGDITIDVNKNGTTILSTKLTIDANEETSETAAVAAVISDTSFALDDEITIDVDAAGTGATGLIVYIDGERTDAAVSFPYSNVQTKTGTAESVTSADAGLWTEYNNASAITLTIDAANLDLYEEGTAVQAGAGQITVVAGGTTTIKSRGSALKTAGQEAIIAWKKTDTDVIRLGGDLTT